jgi:putative nucleotidyltransferase with HDIG domain
MNEKISQQQENGANNPFAKYFETEPELAFVSKLTIELPELKLYMIGGIVRDTLLRESQKEIQSKDFDFVAQGIEIDELIKTLKKHGKVNLVGRSFGVLKFYPEGLEVVDPIDIALPRTEFSEGTGGSRDIKTQSNHEMPIEEDLSRRDLTINAMAYDVTSQQLIDIYDGQNDLEAGIVRAVGVPQDRFQEDYSRMLRAIRFACQFDFRIEENTWQAIKRLIVKINNNTPDEQRAVSCDTIRKEILKALKANPVKALELFDKSGALKEVLPEVEELKDCVQPPEYHSEGDVFEHTKMMLGKIDSPEFKKQFPNAKITQEFIIGLLLHDIGKPKTKLHENGKWTFKKHNVVGEEIAQELMDRLDFSVKQKNKILFMIKHHMFLMSAPSVFQISNKKVADRFIDSPHSQDLLMLFYLDALCSLRPDGSSPMKNFEETLIKLEEIKQIRTNQPEKIEDIITGEEIGNLLKIERGPLVGVVKTVIAELKETGKINSQKEALAFIKKNKKLFLSYKTDLEPALVPRKATNDERTAIKNAFSNNAQLIIEKLLKKVKL